MSTVISPFIFSLFDFMMERKGLPPAQNEEACLFPAVDTTLAYSAFFADQNNYFDIIWGCIYGTNKF